jgi:hypothetical protein
MDRRATLATLLGKKASSSSSTLSEKQAQAPTVLSGLDPYTGPWGFEQAAHLLRRTMYGPTYSQFKDAVAGGLDATVSQLLADQPLPDPPVNYYYQNDPYVPLGETWIDAPYGIGDIPSLVARTQSLYAWTVGNVLNEGVSIREKMTLFWHNHFVTADINDPKFVYNYITLLRTNATGNFRELTKAITVNPSMLRYLNGNQNSASAPNENYARELLELFTVGKGELAGPGDYTTFTEQDVVEIAKVLTGWIDTGFNSISPSIEVGSLFLPFLHDVSTKQLSHRFNDAVITNAGDQEYRQLIDIIFEQDVVARFICRKLYRWFVYYEIDDVIEQNVIEPMAQCLIDNDYEIKPVLELFLKSSHFYDMLNVGPMIKNPIDFTLGIFKQYDVQIPSGLFQRYTAWLTIAGVFPQMQMEYYGPPDVAGWKAYYQAPAYYRIWINSVTLPIRMEATDLMVSFGFPVGGQTIRIEPLEFITTIDNAEDPNALIEEFAKILFPQPITENQKAYLKEILIPGLPDFEWTVEYTDYLSDPNNGALAASIDFKLRSLLKTMMNMPEYFLS